MILYYIFLNHVCMFSMKIWKESFENGAIFKISSEVCTFVYIHTTSYDGIKVICVMIGSPYFLWSARNNVNIPYMYYRLIFCYLCSIWESHGLGESPVTFGSWMVMGLPMATINLIFVWLWLVLFFNGWRSVSNHMYIYHWGYFNYERICPKHIGIVGYNNSWHWGNISI